MGISDKLGSFETEISRTPKQPMTGVWDTAWWTERLDRAILHNVPYQGIIEEPDFLWERMNITSGKVLAALFKFYRPSSVLDAGCGLGNLCEYVPPSIKYVGVDFTPKFIDLARKEYPSREFHVVNCLDMSQFEDGVFDLVFVRGMEGTVRVGYSDEAWMQMQAELLRVSWSVLATLSMYQPHRYDIINKNGDRIMCTIRLSEEEMNLIQEMEKKI